MLGEMFGWIGGGNGIKVIFDSEKQFLEVAEAICVDDMRVERNENCCEDCAACWEKFIDVEVEE